MRRLFFLLALAGCAGLPPEVVVRAEAHAADVRSRADSVVALVTSERAQVAQLLHQVREVQAQAVGAAQVAQQALDRPAEVVTRVTERVAARVDVAGLMGQLKAHGARLEDLQGELATARRLGGAAAGVVDSLRALVRAGHDEASSLRDGLAEVQAVLALARQGGGALGLLGAIAVAGLALWRRRSR